MSKLGKEGTKWSFLKLLSWIIGQNVYSVCLLQNPKGGNVKCSRGMQWAAEMEFLERERLTSL